MCKDPALTYLNQYGYNVVKLPRVGIQPLDVLGRDTALEKLGTLSEIWTSKQPVPQPTAQAPASGVTGQKSGNLDLGVGLKILANALAGMGAAIGLPTLNAAYKKARSVQFKFGNVFSTQISAFAIGKYLADGTLDTNNPFVARYFGNDGTQEYILSEVLVSDTVSVTARDDGSTELKLDIPAIQNVIGLNVDVRAGTSSQGEVLYQSKSQLTFGFKAYEVSFSEGKWVVQGIKPDGGLAFDVAEMQTAATEVLLAKGQFVRMST